jgi:TPR repeat protein
LHEAAIHGLAQAQYDLAMEYEKSNILLAQPERQQEKVKKWLNAAATQGHAAALKKVKPPKPAKPSAPTEDEGAEHKSDTEKLDGDDEPAFD